VDKWRFLNTGFSPGAKNMAIDDVLATQAVLKENFPVFRIYGWQPYAISLGYGQNPKDLKLQKCKQDGIDVVRRPTGGRAVFHAEEITYSVIIPKASKFYSKDILTTYNLISEALLLGLSFYGLKAQLVKRLTNEIKDGAYKNDIPCFSSSAEYEIVCENKKLVGSAQRRFENSVLQHGSILTGTSHLKLVDYITYSDDLLKERFKKELKKKTISISQILNQAVDQNKLIESLKLGIQKKFNIRFTEKQLTPQDVNEVNKKMENYHLTGGNDNEN